MSHWKGYAHWDVGDSYLPATVQPPAESWRVEPLTLEELDRHPDAARIWATVMVVRSSLASADDMQDLVEEHATAVKDFNTDMEKLQDELDAMADALKKATDSDLRRQRDNALEELEESQDRVNSLTVQLDEAKAAERAMYETVRIVTMTRKRQRSLGRVSI